MDKTRIRGKNYTEREKEFLLDIVDKYLVIVENKQTDNASVKEKTATWDKIAIEFNTVAQTGDRNGTQLKLLYETIKMKAKKDKARDKVELPKKVEGSFVKQLDSIGEKVLSMTNCNDIDLQNPYDSSAPLGKKAKLDNIDSEKEIVKLEILKIRKEKEEIERDILLLQKIKLELEIKELSKKYG